MLEFLLAFLLELLAGIFFEAVIEFAADLLGALAVRTFKWRLDGAEIATPLSRSWHRSRQTRAMLKSRLRPLSQPVALRMLSSYLRRAMRLEIFLTV
jgi:hypothetical protein